MIGTSVINIINTILDKKLKYDRTFKSTIWEKNNDGTYKISYMNQLYKDKKFRVERLIFFLPYFLRF